ncbi:Ras-related protein Rab-6.1 [Tritrichomonas foetus]|uniref:Ras-related protein Rab-6.1 n=1 Tax=Tritrichomonas foetus TaxID=1144522 RepID=A0A1J4J0R1_9EUKA|nr:Ras-related protein Rab-6.1 [Tritrichomonas foetus]|eukprot:OHS92994.1 Ras-related protein Rab-6.1 [Tritrichomonas foetus]
MTNCTKERYRLVLVGEQLVGKTSIVNRAICGSFSETAPQTVGGGFESLTVRANGRSLRFQIWDTAGQTCYRSIATSYIRGAKVAIIVFALNDLKSFEETSHWFYSISNLSDNSIQIYLVGNKCDRERLISKSDAEEFAKENGAKYIETSAKTGEGIEEIFDEIAWDMCKLKKKKNPCRRRTVTFDNDTFTQQFAAASKRKNSSGCLLI